MLVRKVIDPQMKLGEIDISHVKLNPRGRDEMEKILKGLQHIYSTPEIRNEIFSYLKTIVPEETNKKTGRPGMHLWKIFVLGIVRMGKGCDIDGLHDYANNHFNVRAIMGHQRSDETGYDMETLRRNMALFNPEVLDDINQIIVKAGHKIVLKKTNK